AFGETELREHWRDIGYWWWLWRERVPTEAKAALGVLLVCGLLAGGWFAADRLTSARASVGTNDLVLETTVQKVVKKIVPVVKRVYLRPKTSYETQTKLKYSTRVLTTPGKVKAVKRLVTTR